MGGRHRDYVRDGPDLYELARAVIGVERPSCVPVSLSGLRSERTLELFMEEADAVAGIIGKDATVGQGVLDAMATLYVGCDTRTRVYCGQRLTATVQALYSLGQNGLTLDLSRVRNALHAGNLLRGSPEESLRLSLLASLNFWGVNVQHAELSVCGRSYFMAFGSLHSVFTMHGKAGICAESLEDCHVELNGEAESFGLGNRRTTYDVRPGSSITYDRRGDG